MIIRALGAADAAAFKAIRVQATEEAQTSVYQTPAEESARPLEELQIQLTDRHSRVFGAFEGEQLVGISGISRDPESKRRHTARIRLLYVSPAHRSRGIARQLLTSVVDYAASIPGIRQIKLSVTCNNASAQHLYAAFGFKTYATDPNVLRVDGQFIDEALMLLVLR
jgi:ribosomal protein S18 acetylase RimI-like enzyme